MSLTKHKYTVLAMLRSLLLSSRYYPSKTKDSLPRDIVLEFQDHKNLDPSQDADMIKLKLIQAQNGLRNLQQYENIARNSSDKWTINWS